MISTSLSARLRQNLYMKQHLELMTTLIGRAVLKEDLGSLEQAEAMREVSQGFINQPVTTCDVPFADKKSDRFKRFIHKLQSANSSAIYLWTEHSYDCGLLLIPSLSEIKFDFDFAIDRNGMLTCMTNDFCDRLTLDFSIINDVQMLTIETQGKHWVQINY
jgi:hypothetical protein